MLKSLSLFIGLASALAAQTIREARLDPKQAVDLPVSREVTTVMFPGPITAVAGADMLIEGGKQSVEVEEGTPRAFSCLTMRPDRTSSSCAVSSPTPLRD